MEQGEIIQELNRIIAENGGEVPKDENAEFNAYFVYWLLAYLYQK